MLRSDIQLNAQSGIMWFCAICMVWTIHTDQLAFPSYSFIGYLLAAIVLPVFCVGIMRLCQLVTFTFLKRSKKYEFIDDVKGAGFKQKLILSNSRDESGRFIELGDTKSNLPLGFVLYALAVLFSLFYKSEIYFIAALLLTAGLIATSIVILAKSGFSVNKALERGIKSLSHDDGVELSLPSDQYPGLAQISIGRLNTRIKFSRVWAFSHLYWLGMWIPLFLAIPLIGQLFAGAFWLGVGVGVGYLFIVEMCALITLYTAFERYCPPVGST